MCQVSWLNLRQLPQRMEVADNDFSEDYCNFQLSKVMGGVRNAKTQFDLKYKQKVVVATLCTRYTDLNGIFRKSS